MSEGDMKVMIGKREKRGDRRITFRDIATGVFILLTTGLIVGILLQGFLSIR